MTRKKITRANARVRMPHYTGLGIQLLGFMPYYCDRESVRKVSEEEFDSLSREAFKKLNDSELLSICSSVDVTGKRSLVIDGQLLYECANPARR